ncbi:hypothetical protein CO180_01480 [candidate division WWE3 bacterium CG_4_9_14_3_um_filter_41_6]|uniref:Uncharacterized protein n=1 Tax=candidate division WWE3 bacterium CG_4_10_14_0_2_um_filter_41_14 TaxID=1975072 RepID=A0A2M7TKR6_UNCKA|nr:MAG: hypothetical protein COY32_01565 [candidate division WWE3 bacterium CG_4_10_14_0_2_um_filter_41_14]PJA39149.1 MAG: hypothetical protein CO180_01480 [candidate division WWE3 bacterium CG_4_9_14_3_um_filter_41_6]
MDQLVKFSENVGHSIFAISSALATNTVKSLNDQEHDSWGIDAGKYEKYQILVQYSFLFTYYLDKLLYFYTNYDGNKRNRVSDIVLTNLATLTDEVLIDITSKVAEYPYDKIYKESYIYFLEDFSNYKFPYENTGEDKPGGFLEEDSAIGHFANLLWGILKHDTDTPLAFSFTISVMFMAGIKELTFTKLIDTYKQMED